MIALRNQPLFVILMMISSAAMYVPMVFAARLENWLIARTFFYHATVLLIIAAMLAIAMSARPLSQKSASRLADLAAAFLLLPFLMALPVAHLVPQISLFQAYFEMLSCMTTTGASVLSIPESVPDTIHLWRALVAWLGGLMMLVVALAIFQPINLGGFEIYSKDKKGIAIANRMKRADTRERILRFTLSIFPVYFALTSVLALCLIISGDRVLVAVVHAMSTLSTSGISPVGGLSGAESGIMGEAFIFMFLLCAISRYMFLQDKEGQAWRHLKSDKEVNLALWLVIVIPLFLFLRHWLGAQDFAAPQNLAEGFASLWGGVFTVMSFLSTTGFESQSWEAARDWSGLPTLGLILMGLSVMGGGIATTAGGVKLLRVYALYKHGLREMQRLSFPHSVGGSGQRARGIRREGAYAAWIFFMLFLVSTAIIMLCLSATGLQFDAALLLAIAGLSNTGPLIEVVGDSRVTYAQISDGAKGILCVAMVLGRLEALAVIAIFNPNYWRK